MGTLSPTTTDIAQKCYFHILDDIGISEPLHNGPPMEVGNRFILGQEMTTDRKWQHWGLGLVWVETTVSCGPICEHLETIYQQKYFGNLQLWMALYNHIENLTNLFIILRPQLFNPIVY